MIPLFMAQILALNAFLFVSYNGFSNLISQCVA